MLAIALALLCQRVRPAELLDFGQARIRCNLSHYPLVSGFELVFIIQGELKGIQLISTTHVL